MNQWVNEDLLGNSFLKKKKIENWNWLKKKKLDRFFLDKPVPLSIIEDIIRAAGTSPSGAHTEVFFFQKKKKILPWNQNWNWKEIERK